MANAEKEKKIELMKIRGRLARRAEVGKEATFTKGPQNMYVLVGSQNTTQQYRIKG